MGDMPVVEDPRNFKLRVKVDCKAMDRETIVQELKRIAEDIGRGVGAAAGGGPLISCRWDLTDILVKPVLPSVFQRGSTDGVPGN